MVLFSIQHQALANRRDKLKKLSPNDHKFLSYMGLIFCKFMRFSASSHNHSHTVWTYSKCYRHAVDISPIAFWTSNVDSLATSRYRKFCWDAKIQKQQVTVDMFEVMRFIRPHPNSQCALWVTQKW